MTKKTETSQNSKIDYFDDAQITCSCGAVYNVGSTAKEIKVEICANCHPFYTGTQKFIDTAGRVEKFKAKVEAGKKYQEQQEQLKGKRGKGKVKEDNKNMKKNNDKTADR